MAPEAPGNLVLLDLELKNSEVRCEVDRYDPEGANKRLMVSWNAMQRPSGSDPVGGGVAFVWRPPGYTHRIYRAILNPLKNGRFSWGDKVYGDGLMLIIVLPLGFVLPSVDDADPLPVVSKVFNRRMALYWFVRGNGNDRAQVSWRFERAKTQAIAAQCRSLNEEANRRAKRPVSIPVVVDPRPDEISPDLSESISKHEPVIREAPDWHHDRVIETTLVDRALTTYQKGSGRASWVFGSILVLVFIIMLFFFPYPSDFQRDMARFLAAISGGLFAFFFVGGVTLSGGLRGVTIGAAGGFAIFVAMQFFIHPFPPQKTDETAILKEWKGGERLGSLLNTLRDKALTGEVEEQIRVDPAKKIQIENLSPRFDRVTGKTWAEVFKRICGNLGCLRCDISSDGRTIELSLSGEVEKSCEDADCKKFIFTCK